MARIEYTEEHPLSTDSEDWDALSDLIYQRCMEATKDLGEFGPGLGGHTDGAIYVQFGPNMLVDWEAVKKTV